MSVRPSVGMSSALHLEGGLRVFGPESCVVADQGHVKGDSPAAGRSEGSRSSVQLRCLAATLQREYQKLLLQEGISKSEESYRSELPCTDSRHQCIVADPWRTMEDTALFLGAKAMILLDAKTNSVISTIPFSSLRCVAFNEEAVVSMDQYEALLAEKAAATSDVLNFGAVVVSVLPHPEILLFVDHQSELVGEEGPESSLDREKLGGSEFGFLDERGLANDGAGPSEASRLITDYGSGVSPPSFTCYAFAIQYPSARCPNATVLQSFEREIVHRWNNALAQQKTVISSWERRYPGMVSGQDRGAASPRGLHHQGGRVTISVPQTSPSTDEVRRTASSSVERDRSTVSTGGSVPSNYSDAVVMRGIEGTVDVPRSGSYHRSSSPHQFGMVPEGYQEPLRRVAQASTQTPRRTEDFPLASLEAGAPSSPPTSRFSPRSHQIRASARDLLETISTSRFSGSPPDEPLVVRREVAPASSASRPENDTDEQSNAKPKLEVTTAQQQTTSSPRGKAIAVRCLYCGEMVDYSTRTQHASRCSQGREKDVL